MEIPRRVRSLGAYRARQCLLYLAEHPGASNTHVAQAIGVRYQGQMSVLLTGLEKEGLLAGQGWTVSLSGRKPVRAAGRVLCRSTARCRPG